MDGRVGARDEIQIFTGDQSERFLEDQVEFPAPDIGNCTNVSDVAVGTFVGRR